MIATGGLAPLVIEESDCDRRARPLADTARAEAGLRAQHRQSCRTPVVADSAGGIGSARARSRPRRSAGKAARVPVEGHAGVRRSRRAATRTALSRGVLSSAPTSSWRCPFVRCCGIDDGVDEKRMDAPVPRDVDPTDERRSPSLRRPSQDCAVRPGPTSPSRTRARGRKHAA